jgi:hypothetical protein
MECKHYILVETDTYTSSICHTCEIVHIHDGIYSFGFTIQAFKEWGSQILNLRYENHCIVNDDFNYLKVYSYLHHYEFHFFKEQFEEYQDLIGQSLSLLEAYNLIGEWN